VTGPTGFTGQSGADSTVTGPTGFTGQSGADSIVTGPTGFTGQSGADSTVTGPTGFTGQSGADSTVTGPTGFTGQSGADSIVTGPTGFTGQSGADSIVTGPTGFTGQSGADSIVTGPTGPCCTGSTGSTGPSALFTNRTAYVDLRFGSTSGVLQDQTRPYSTIEDAIIAISALSSIEKSSTNRWRVQIAPSASSPTPGPVPQSSTYSFPLITSAMAYIDFVGESIDTTVSEIGFTGLCDNVFESLTISSTNAPAVLVTSDSVSGSSNITSSNITFSNCAMVSVWTSSSLSADTSCVSLSGNSSTRRKSSTILILTNNTYTLTQSAFSSTTGTRSISIVNCISDALSALIGANSNILIQGGRGTLNVNTSTGRLDNVSLTMVKQTNYSTNSPVTITCKDFIGNVNTFSTTVAGIITSGEFAIHSVGQGGVNSNTSERTIARSIGTTLSDNVRYTWNNFAISGASTISGADFVIGIAVGEDDNVLPCTLEIWKSSHRIPGAGQGLTSGFVYTGRSIGGASATDSRVFCNIIDAITDRQYIPPQQKSTSLTNGRYSFSLSDYNGTRGSNGGLQTNVLNVTLNATTLNYTIGDSSSNPPQGPDSDSTIFVTSTLASLGTINLPNQMTNSSVQPSRQPGRIYVIKNVGTRPVQVSANSSTPSPLVTIDGSTTPYPLGLNQSVALQSDGKDWKIIYDYLPEECLVPAGYVARGSVTSPLVPTTVNTPPSAPIISVNKNNTIQFSSSSSTYAYVSYHENPGSLFVLDKTSSSPTFVSPNSNYLGIDNGPNQTQMYIDSSSNEYWTCVTNTGRFYWNRMNSQTNIQSELIAQRNFVQIATLNNQLSDHDIQIVPIVTLPSGPPPPPPFPTVPTPIVVTVGNQAGSRSIYRFSAPPSAGTNLTSTLFAAGVDGSGVRIIGNYAYVCQNVNLASGQLEVYDVSVAITSAPSLSTTTSLTIASAAFIPQGIRRHPTLPILYITSGITNTYIVVDVDVTNLNPPSIVSSGSFTGNRTPDSGSWTFFTKCSILYAMVNTLDGNHTFFSLKDPRFPVPILSFTFPGVTNTGRSNIDTDYNIYVLDRTGVPNTIRVYNPTTCLSCCSCSTGSSPGAIPVVAPNLFAALERVDSSSVSVTGTGAKTMTAISANPLMYKWHTGEEPTFSKRSVISPSGAPSSLQILEDEIPISGIADQKIDVIQNDRRIKSLRTYMTFMNSGASGGTVSVCNIELRIRGPTESTYQLVQTNYSTPMIDQNNTTLSCNFEYGPIESNSSFYFLVCFPNSASSTSFQDLSSYFVVDYE